MKKNIVIALLLIIIILMGGTFYYLYTNQDKICDKCEVKEEKKSIESKQEEILDITSKEVTTLLNGINRLAINDKSKAYYAYLYRNDELKVENMSDDLLIANILYKEYLNCGDKCIIKASNSSELDTFVISASTIKDEIKKLFGNLEYKDTNVEEFDCQGDFKFDSASNNYTHKLAGCGYGLVSQDKLETHIIKAIKNNNSIDIYVKVAFEYIKIDENNAGSGVNDNSMRLVYSDYNKTNKIYEKKEIEYDESEMLENYGEKLPIYKIHFEYENGTYHFKQINKEK